MRLFIAIQPDKEFRSALRAVQNELRRRGVEGNYTRVENLHLTLAFIGEYPDPNAVLEAMEKVSFDPFTLRLAGLGAFGDLWWAGLEDSGGLDALVRRLHLIPLLLPSSNCHLEERTTSFSFRKCDFMPHTFF